jgi:leader peptidase (prepilin peptidase)/N-methyltransferase
LTRALPHPKMRAGMPGLDFTLLLRTPAFETMALLFGLIVGSFANVCIHRLPRDYEPSPGRLGPLRDLARQASWLVTPRSRCPRCGDPIQAWDNLPVLSWLALRGRCRSCRAPISVRYPLVEAANGLLWLALAVTRGPHARTAVDALLVTILLILLLIDLEHQLLPDVLTLPGAALGLAASLLPRSSVSPIEAVTAAVAGYLGFAALAWTWQRLRGVEALGQGDWKMAAMLGAFLGWERLLLTLLLASAAGSIVGLALIAARRGRWQSRLPLGSFLSAAGILVVFFAGAILGWHRSLFGG